MEDLSKYIIFQLNKQSYGVNVQQVMSIEKMSNITEVPKSSHLVKGIINLHGEVTPIIDLKERLQLGKTTYTEHTRLLIVSIHDVKLGLIVDEATDVVDIDSSLVEKAPTILRGVDESFLQGVAKLEDQLMILLDLDYVLNFEEINEIKEVATN